MTDIVDKATRSRMMSGIRGINTKPELIIRRGLHKRGFRYRLHDKRLPGKPDIVLPRHKAIILVHGCFWHGHDCNFFKWPTSRREFWRDKIGGTQKRDQIYREEYRRKGWRALTIWECAIKGKNESAQTQVIEQCAVWIKSGEPDKIIRGAKLGET